MADQNGFSVKELSRELNREKYDLKRVPVYLVINNERYEVASVELYDDTVHLGAGQKVDSEVKIMENGEG